MEKFFCDIGIEYFIVIQSDLGLLGEGNIEIKCEFIYERGRQIFFMFCSCYGNNGIEFNILFKYFFFGQIVF